jgi:small neutral amino acid transporter SnatA (MarC family)
MEKKMEIKNLKRSEFYSGIFFILGLIFLNIFYTSNRTLGIIGSFVCLIYGLIFMYSKKVKKYTDYKEVKK